MSKFSECPKCHIKPKDYDWTGGYIQLHKCKDGNHLFCNNCKNGDRCPFCGSSNVWWDYEKAYG